MVATGCYSSRARPGVFGPFRWLSPTKTTVGAREIRIGSRNYILEALTETPNEVVTTGSFSIGSGPDYRPRRACWRPYHRPAESARCRDPKLGVTVTGRGYRFAGAVDAPEQDEL